MISNSKSGPFKILFVCLGNICRSPAAEGTMQKLINDNKLGESIEVDSAGTSNWEARNPPDSRMISACKKRGIRLTHYARQITQDDLKKFDLIVTMDDSNYNNVISIGGDKKKVQKMMSFVTDKKGNTEVPDPWYGGMDGFELVLDLVYDGCIGILKKYGFLK